MAIDANDRRTSRLGRDETVGFHLSSDSIRPQAAGGESLPKPVIEAIMEYAIDLARQMLAAVESGALAAADERYLVDVMEPSASPVDRLKDMGFRECGEWRLQEGRLKCILTDNAAAPNVLYAFVSGETVMYVGKTVRSLKKRMYGYQNPGPTQSTNIKGNKLIGALLSGGASVKVHALPDNGLLYYGGFHVNLAAGLEDSLIASLKPKWNKGAYDV
ncbi:GIY-YIG nuclease family protein [Candidatus Accumulibacter sp. ACC012]|uniref:GIY-YIG nuclease family protein n=1 Tax=Candidatus Accumulibacter sp. ACC012 TaxID=2823332 RepID=UPI0025BABB19|nr:GIY-YIG nuclease family protein [Candidatus Accumulibacter sp. ACC012]